MANLAAPTPSSRTASASAIFNLHSPAATSPPSSSDGDDGHQDDDDNDDDDDAPLPFPSALPRSDFLAPTFDPAAYLSALPHRHQTLEDLRSDLRDRSAAISAELLALVNGNYTAFLSLGYDLRGGDERVEDVRVSLLGFRRAVDDVRGKVARRGEETAALGQELRSVRGKIETGRAMLEVSDRLGALEERLSLGSPLPGRDSGATRQWDGVSSDEEDEEDEEDGEDEDQGRERGDGGGGGGGAASGLIGSSPVQLAESARQCRHITTVLVRLDQDHPFVIKQEERLTRCRNTLLLDLGNALKEAKGAGARGQDRVLKYLAIYRTIDAHDEAIKALRKK